MASLLASARRSTCKASTSRDITNISSQTTEPAGGHILDYVLEQGTLTFGAISKLVIDLPENADFLNANLTPENLDDAIRSVES